MNAHRCRSHSHLQTHRHAPPAGAPPTRPKATPASAVPARLLRASIACVASSPHAPPSKKKAQCSCDSGGRQPRRQQRLRAQHRAAAAPVAAVAAAKTGPTPCPCLCWWRPRRRWRWPCGTPSRWGPTRVSLGLGDIGGVVCLSCTVWSSVTHTSIHACTKTRNRPKNGLKGAALGTPAPPIHIHTYEIDPTLMI